MHPDFDLLMDSALGALSFVDEQLKDASNPPLLMLANAVRDLGAAVLLLAEHSTIPRRA